MNSFIIEYWIIAQYTYVSTLGYYSSTASIFILSPAKKEKNTNRILKFWTQGTKDPVSCNTNCKHLAIVLHAWVMNLTNAIFRVQNYIQWSLQQFRESINIAILFSHRWSLLWVYNILSEQLFTLNKL